MNLKEKEQSLKLAEYYFRDNNYEFTQAILNKVIKIDPNNSKANELLSYIHRDLGQFDKSFELLEVACNQNDCSPEALYYLGSAQLKKGFFDQTIESLKKSMSRGGEFFEALHDLATAQARIGDFPSALNNYQKCLKFGATRYELFYNIARIYDELKRYDEAIAHYDKAISLKPDYVVGWFNKGITLHELKRYDEAIDNFNKVLSLKPNYHEAWNISGVIFHELKRYDEAIAYYDKAISLSSDYYLAWINKGLTLYQLKCFDEAIVHYDKALNLRPDYAEGWSLKGNALNKLKRYDEAINHYDKALSLNPDYAEGWSLKGNALNKLKRYDEAINHYHKALSLNPDIDWVCGDLVHGKMKICDWSDLVDALENMSKKVTANENAVKPFLLLALNDNALLHRKSSEIFAESQHPSHLNLVTTFDCIKNEKIRVGYFSADLKNHPVAHLIAELIEIHDKNRFEIYAFSLEGAADEMRERLRKAFDHFIHVEGMSDFAIAQRARDLTIDIAVDLSGLTGGSRTGIFSYRAAPIQVNYLGYPGTMGVDYIDYIVADKTLIPLESQSCYSEKVIYLPNSYQVNDRKRFISDRAFTRQELGLPENGFIFCCFNNNFKILPTTFASWMRILKTVEGSALWLFQDNPWVVDNLKKEALNHGIHPGRLVFAERMPLSEHLARHHQADLFLDTAPYNAHTTASDALWTGLPVLTLMGRSFASRVAASLLNAIGLPELITNTQEEYEALAIELAMNPKKLEIIKLKLANNRLTAPLFDTPLFTKNLEAAYIKMYERYQNDLGPDHIAIV